MPSSRDANQQPAYVRALELYEHPGVNSDIDVIGPALRAARRELDDLTRLAVARALERKEPWSRIGPALGVTRQAAQQKYGRTSAA